METRDEQFISELYRETLSRELRRPQIQQDKQEFLRRQFSIQPHPAFAWASLGFSLPAIFLVAALGFFIHLQETTKPLAGPALPIHHMFGPVMEQAKARKAAEAANRYMQQQESETRVTTGDLKDPVENYMKPRVVVKRVSSKTGATMVYQRAYRDVPVTIVWVFPGKGPT